MKLVVKIATLVVVALMMGVVDVRAASCKPDCGGKEMGDFVVNPYNCSEYYVCLGDGIYGNHPVACDADNHFEGDVCVPDTADPPCESICAGGSGGCHLACNHTLDFVSDFSDCTKYYVCTPGGVDGPLTCGADRPYFDGTECTNDDSSCCQKQDMCQLDCEAEKTLVPDPHDCTRYYYCVAAGPLNEDFHFTCPNGENFDVHLGQCSKTAQCTILCSSTPSGGAEGGETTTAPSSSGCVTSFTCPTGGYFPACDTCTPQYFACSAAGEQGTLDTCSDGLVFNTNPEYPICVREDNCPYPN